MAQRVTVTVNEGKVRGVKKISAFSGVEYYSFFGIPYGQNTRGANRLKPPIKVKPWNDILDATMEQKQGCLQYSLRLHDFVGSEDCLYNNIHTPKLPSENDPLMPVIVLLHPGGLQHGSPENDQYGSPEYIMHQNVVYVGIAYRLHFLGFLNLGLDECPGNQGLRDIILGLEWIRDNISSFGGDPNNVTLLGSSSGGALVHNFLISPRAQGLFHKAVLMGGYLFNPLRLTLKENAAISAELVSSLGYTVPDKEDKKKLLSIYRKLNANQFLEFQPDKKMNMVIGAPFPVSPIGPTIDHGKDAVHPIDFRKSIPTTARVPILFGICERESIAAFCRGLRKGTMAHFVEAMRHNQFGWAHDLTDDELKYIRHRLEEFYCNGERIESAPLATQTDVYTDLANSDLYDSLLNVVAKDLPDSVYVYKFNFEGNAWTLKDLTMVMLEEPLSGTFHAADFSYWTPIINRGDNPNPSLNKETVQMIHKFTKIVTQFAKTGDPNNEDLKIYWPPSKVDKPCYLKIDNEMEVIEGKLNGERVEFWEKLKHELRNDY